MYCGFSTMVDVKAHLEITENINNVTLWGLGLYGVVYNIYLVFTANTHLCTLFTYWSYSWPYLRFFAVVQHCPYSCTTLRTRSNQGSLKSFMAVSDSLQLYGFLSSNLGMFSVFLRPHPTFLALTTFFVSMFLSSQIHALLCDTQRQLCEHHFEVIIAILMKNWM